MVEVFLRAGTEQEDLDYGLSQSVWQGRLDLAQLLVSYGANLETVCADSVIGTRNPPLIRWFIDNGMDLEEGQPIAQAFRYRHREFLGIYLSIRDRVPSARKQAAMALRFHARNGNLKWVSLLLWAGVDPSSFSPPVPDDGSPGTNMITAAFVVAYGEEQATRMGAARDERERKPFRGVRSPDHDGQRMWPSDAEFDAFPLRHFG